MYAIVRTGNGGYYCSAVFGHYTVITSSDDYQRYLEKTWNNYFVVFSPEKNALIAVSYFDASKRPYLEPVLLFLDGDQSDWEVDENGDGWHRCLADDTIRRRIQENKSLSDPPPLCGEIDDACIYQEYQQIETESDIDRLMLLSGSFHDARIRKLEKQEDGRLYVLFDGTWGCTVELWLDGDVSYCTKSRDPEYFDPYWLESNMFFDGGYLYFVDDASVKGDLITDDFCWFRAKRMTYHIIPL